MASRFETLLEQWLENGTVSPASAGKMLQDWRQDSAEKAGSNWTIAIATIGSLLLGVAALSFVALNWEELSRFAKIFLAVGSTTASLVAGWQLQTERIGLPKVGIALLFLASLLFGATLTLITQVYNLSGAPWRLLALWTIGILPIAYIFHSGAILRLATLTSITALLLYWSGANMLSESEFGDAIAFSFTRFNVILLFSCLLFAIGSVHLLFPQLANFGKVLRLLGIKIYLFLLFWLTFPDIAAEMLDSSSNWYYAKMNFPTFWKTTVLTALTIGTIAYYLKQNQQPLNKHRNEITGVSVAIGFALLVTAVMRYEPDAAIIPSILANLIFAAGAGLLLFEGYRRENLKAINFATFAIGIFIFGKYIDLFYEPMDATAFFFLGGAILITVSIFLEKYRRKLIHNFAIQK